MAIRDEILTLKNKENTLAGNKVCNFAYDDTAFEDDTTTGADGVSTYNYNNHNNIPTKDPSVLKVNPTIISKGFRSQVSTLSRMLLNHIFGRVSYNLNKTVDTFNSLLANLYNYIGQPNGLATLDNTGKLPYSQLPLSAVEYKGTWNASTNTPTLASGTGTFGDEYIVSTQGTQNIGEGSITYRVGDRVIYNGSIWQRIPASSVRTVNAKTPDADGNVTVNASDVVTPDVYGYDKSDMGKVYEPSANTSWVEMTDVLYIRDWGLFVASFRDSSTSTWSLKWSADGVNWTVCTGGVSYCTTMYYANGMLVVAGGTSPSASVYYSTDGKAFSLATIDLNGSYSFNLTSLRYANNTWVMCCQDDTVTANRGIYKSVDGINWTHVNITYQSTNYDANIIDYGKDRWIVGTVGRMYWSTDLATFTPITGTAQSVWTMIKYINGVWIAGFLEHIYYSTDGETFTSITTTDSSTPHCFNDVQYFNGLWVASANARINDTEGGIWTSTDGMSWTRRYTSHNCNLVRYTGTIWVASTCYGESSYGYGMLYSIDGITWERATTDYQPSWSHDYTCTALAFSPNIIVAGLSTVSSRVDYLLFKSIGSQTNNVATILDWLLYVVDNVLDN